MYELMVCSLSFQTLVEAKERESSGTRLRRR